MSIFDDNNYIEITKDDINDAALSSNHLAEEIKKRAFANVLGARLGIKFLKQLGINASNFSSIYTIPAILKDMDISDIYTENNIKADIRIVPDENHLFIPKSQFVFNILPDIYIFIKLSADFSTAEYIGAIAPEDIDKSFENSDYYFVSKDKLYNENSLKNALSKGKPKSNIQVSESDIIKAESMLINFIDKDILNNEKHYVYDILTKSEELRQFFKNFEQFELISTDLAHTEEILSDSVLDVLGAQQIYKNDLSDGDFALDIDLDEIANTTAADFTEDFIYESNEDENMPNNENIIEGEFKELPEDADFEEAGILEDLPSDEELANLSLNDNFELENNISLDETENSHNLEGFEGFEGLEADNSEISFEDFNVSIDNDMEISSDSNLETNQEENIIEDMFDNDTTNNKSPDEYSELTEENNNDDEIKSSETDLLEQVEELQPLENFDNELDNSISTFEENEYANKIEHPVDNSVSFDDVIDNLNTDENATLDDISSDEVDFSEFEMSNLTDENTDIEAQNVSELESFEQPIDLTLPDLVPTEALPELENIEDTQENFTFDEIQNGNALNENDETLTLDDIAETVNFENTDITEDDFANIVEVEPLEELMPIENLNNIDLGDIKENEQNIDITDNESEQNNNVQNIQEIIQPEAQEESSKNEDEDFSGLEEFTMDMAAAVEESNPHVHNPQLPRENIDIQNTIDNITAETAQMNENFGLEAFEPEQNTMETYSSDTSDNVPVETYNQNAIGEMEMETYSPETSDTSIYDNAFDNAFDNEFNANSQQDNNDNTTNFDNVNLDDLDNFDDIGDALGLDDTSNIDNIDTDFDNLNTDDIDISNINLDDIDINDPNLNIENLDLNEFDVDNLSSIENIPDITEQNNNYDMPPENYNQYEENSINQEMGMPEPNNEEYVPNFNQNDQSTIEALYEGNSQNQNLGEAVDNSFNNNDVNPTYQTQPVKEKKKTSPLLGILLIVLICAFAYMKKDLILEKFNENKGVTVAQDQNMPVEGETQEDKEDAELLNDNTPPEDENSENTNQGIGDIPGESGGPQDAASMEASLHQAGSQANNLPPNTYAKTPEPLASSEIKRLYWEIPQELTYNDAVINYLKTVGKAMKFAIQSDLLNISEMPYSSKMIVDVVIKKDGSFDNVVTTVSSGSKQIDAIVLQSVKAALKYVKAPTSEFKNDSYNFSLIINF